MHDLGTLGGPLSEATALNNICSTTRLKMGREGFEPSTLGLREPFRRLGESRPSSPSTQTTNDPARSWRQRLG
jgi:hypothetical protein